MINLIKNEYIKIFKKKTIYILFIIMFLFVIFSGIIEKVFNDYEYNCEDEISFLSSQLDDPYLKDSKEDYVSIKTQLGVTKVKCKYETFSWQFNLADEKLFSLYFELYSLDEKSDDYDSKKKYYEDEINLFLKYFESDNWQYFTNEDLKVNNDSIVRLTEQIKVDSSDDLKNQLEIEKVDKYLNEYRLKENVSYATSYLNDAIGDYKNNYLSLINYDINPNSYDSKIQYNNLKSNFAISKYILDTKQDVNNSSDLRYSLMNYMSSYSLFILIIVVVISGSIVSEEFNKGTVKSLLVRPYSRTKILLSKFIVSLSLVVISAFVLFIMSFIVGSILYGFDSLQVPAVVYNFNAGEVVTYNIFVYGIIQLLYNLPTLVICLTIAFMVSTLFNNTALAIALTLLASFGSSIINMIAMSYNIKLMKYFITLNWDFNQFAFGRLPDFKYISIGFSSVICLIYLIIMIGLSILVFKKRNIKNI